MFIGWITNNGVPTEPYSKEIQNDQIQHKNKINGNVWEPSVINHNIIEQVTDFKYPGYSISEYKSDLEDKLQTYNKINGAIRRHFGKQMNKERKLEFTT